MASLHIQCLVMDTISAKSIQQKLEHKNFQIKSSNNSLNETPIYQKIMIANYATLLQNNNNNNGKGEDILRRTSLPIALTAISSMTTPKTDEEVDSPTAFLLNNANDEWNSTTASIFVNCDEQKDVIKYHNADTSTDMIFYFDTAISSSSICQHHQLKNYAIDNHSNEYDNTTDSSCSIASTSLSSYSSSQTTQIEEYNNHYQNYQLSSPSLQYISKKENNNLATSTAITTNSSIIPPSVIITDHSLVNPIICPLNSVCISFKFIIHSFNL